MNIHDAMERGGTYGILMGNLRRQGAYFNLSSLVERVAPGKLTDELIKAQHNCVSDQRTYGGNVVRIAHEKLLVFRRERGSLHFLAKVQQRAQAMQGITWRAAMRRLLQGGKTLHLKEINTQLEAFGYPSEQPLGGQDSAGRPGRALYRARSAGTYRFAA
ncbi:hypothetical protein ABIC11_004279 [Pseudomonas oryzihabitans]